MKHHIRRQRGKKRKNQQKKRKNQRKNQKGGGVELYPMKMIRNLGLLAGGLNFIMNPENRNAVLSGLSNVYDKMSTNS